MLPRNDRSDPSRSSRPQFAAAGVQGSRRGKRRPGWPRRGHAARAWRAEPGRAEPRAVWPQRRSVRSRVRRREHGGCCQARNGGSSRRDRPVLGRAASSPRGPRYRVAGPAPRASLLLCCPQSQSRASTERWWRRPSQVGGRGEQPGGETWARTPPRALRGLGAALRPSAARAGGRDTCGRS